MTAARLRISVFPLLLLIVHAATDTAIMPPSFPAHWGSPPVRQTRDFVQLPGDYGRGSGTVRRWILEKMAEDDAAALNDASSVGHRHATADDGMLWPDKDLVGMAGEDAKAAVLAGDMALMAAHVHIMHKDDMVTMDYREERVRIFVDDDGKVVRQPTKG
eukprot:CAMPEP_0181116700 /NCGR_PEP_ID=MMETSP1071-20121207/22098_1 /TAXON_ID=35127 /ORGANISM="Thalassiosira sp., Strain NH16" /LENGTH=159 /DNA_ID=CAMNT_0023200977 /DNA_START=62 /DNA_END=541 /DNA_ORIENTATION=-